MIIRGTTSDFTELRRPGLTTSNPPPNNSSAAQPTDCSGALTSVGYPHKGRRFTPAGFHHFVFTNARAEPMPARAATISTKRLSLLKQMQPNMRRVAMLWNRDDLGMSLRYGASAKAAEVLGVGVQALGAREPDDFDGVFEAMDREPPDAILMVSDVLTVLNRKRVFDYAAAKRIPAIATAA